MDESFRSMNILIFKTTGDQSFELLMRKIERTKDNYFIVLPKNLIKKFGKNSKRVRYIATELEYMDYITIMKENKIPKIKFDEIWVLSSAYDKLYSYTEIYAVISELSYRKICYKVIDKKEIQNFALKHSVFTTNINKAVEGIVKLYTDLIYLYEIKIKGYKW